MSETWNFPVFVVMSYVSVVLVPKSNYIVTNLLIVMLGYLFNQRVTSREGKVSLLSSGKT